MRNDNLRTAKAILAGEGIKVLIKDMKSADFTCLLSVPHKNDWDFCHREVITVKMKSGLCYQILRETVDSEGKFSTLSAKFATRKVAVAF